MYACGLFAASGGGTAGVALSARFVPLHVKVIPATYICIRLSEDPSLVVGLIEAGVTHFNDPVVDAAGTYVASSIFLR